MKKKYIVYTTFNKRKLINAELENAIWIELRIKKQKSTKHVYFKTFIPKKIKHSLVILSICETLFYLYTINLKNYL